MMLTEMVLLSAGGGGIVVLEEYEHAKKGVLKFMEKY